MLQAYKSGLGWCSASNISWFGRKQGIQCCDWYLCLIWHSYNMKNLADMWRFRMSAVVFLSVWGLTVLTKEIIICENKTIKWLITKEWSGILIFLWARFPNQRLRKSQISFGPPCPLLGKIVKFNRVIHFDDFPYLYESNNKNYWIPSISCIIQIIYIINNL